QRPPDVAEIAGVGHGCSLPAEVVTDSGCSSVRPRSRGMGERTTNQIAARVPAAPTSIVARRPIQPPRAPPISAPIAAAPVTAKRYPALVRPRTSEVTAAWRTL